MMQHDDLERIVGSLVIEGILEVEPRMVRLHTMLIPANRLLFFQLALSAALNGDTVTQGGEYGYATEKVSLAGSISEGWRITSNDTQEDESILLTRKLATELAAVFAYFLGDEPATPVLLSTQPNEEA